METKQMQILLLCCFLGFLSAQAQNKGIIGDLTSTSNTNTFTISEPDGKCRVETLLDGYIPKAGLNQDTPRILSAQNFDTPSPHIRVSGCFGDGTETQFNIYLPPKEQWKGRFFQRTHPFFGLDPANGDLAFDLAVGAYSVTVPPNTMGHLSQASAAHVSRTIAKNYYKYDKRIYGYLEGGSGGSMQTIGAMELGSGLVWDGAVPFITAASVSYADFDIRWFARAALEEKAPLIADAVRPGGSGDPCAVLTDMERDVFIEVTKLGIPIKAWENYDYLFIGTFDVNNAYPSLTDGLNSIGEINAAYTNAFWNEPGYLEAYNPKLRNLFYSLRERGANEGALAKMVYHRHKDPGPTYRTWDHLRDSDGNPLYAQTPGTHYGIETSKVVSGGAEWTGKINFKTIMVVNLSDLDAFPVNGNYYHERIKEMGRENDFRIWYNENANHHASNSIKSLIDYTGVLEQALLDLSDWVEHGIEPPKSTSYTVVNNQIAVEECVTTRGGIQPKVELMANEVTCATIKSGDQVGFSAKIQVPPGTGKIVSVEWDFTGEGKYVDGGFTMLSEGTWTANASYTYDDDRIYFPQVRVASKRGGDTTTFFARAYNLGRTCVVVGTNTLKH